MKNIIVTIIITIFATASFAQETISDRVEALIPALIKVESNGNEKAIGDKGKAKGILQLHAIYIKDVNAIAGTNYVHDDAFDPEKAKAITRTYLVHYGKAYERKTGNVATFEVLSRIHNGGPKGYLKKATDGYWKKVKNNIK